MWEGNIFFEPLLPEQVAFGLPASPVPAGTGYTTPSVVQDALTYLITGNPLKVHISLPIRKDIMLSGD